MTFLDFPDSEDGTLNQETSDIAIVGVPWDLGATLHTGQRLAPDAIRNLESYVSTYDRGTGIDLKELKIVDCGNMNISPACDLADNVVELRSWTESLILNSKMAIFLGGDHSITAALVSEFGFYLDEKPVVIHLDAHSDLWPHDEYEYYPHHGSWARWVLHQGDAKEVWQLGVRALGPDREDQEKMTGLCAVHTSDPRVNLESAIRVARQNKNVYLSVDLDVVDPAFAPGVSHPEPGGWTSSELLEFIYELTSYGNIKMMDIVECIPARDRGDMTVRLAHRSVIAAMRGYAVSQRRPGGAKTRGE